MTNLKKTPLYDEHVKLGATIVPFAGFEMPLNFSSIIDEHLAVRDCAGIFDVSHMGEIEIAGLDAIKFSDYLCTNRITDMNDGDIKYTIILEWLQRKISDWANMKFATDWKDLEVVWNIHS